MPHPCSVTLIGLGALGILYSRMLLRHPEVCALTCLADRERQARYAREGVFCNDEPLPLRFAAPEDQPERPADLILVCVKGTTLAGAVTDIRNHAGPGTVIVSLLNGITSEEILQKAYPQARVIFCVAQGMDSLRTRQSIRTVRSGMLYLGVPADRPELRPALEKALGILKACEVPCREDPRILHRLCAKWMLNVGLNQTVAVWKGTYGTVQKPCRAREVCIQAMREVMAISQAEGTGLEEADLEEYIALMDSLNPESLPSMRQDTLAGRETEVELFAGTVLEKGRRLGIDTPVNAWLYEEIRKIPHAG